VDALRHAQDRLDEKKLFEQLGIPLPGYRAVATRDDMTAAADVLGLPMVIKTRRLGYDGKGQFVVRAASDVDAAWGQLGAQPLIAEQWVPFDYEVSSIGVRNVDGEIRIYALSHNVHEDGILRVSRSPVDAPLLAEKAAEYVRRLLLHLDYVGVLALELFVKDGQLLANEFAPRVHNSGHWTIEGAATSQFENHLRAVMNLPLGSTANRGHAGMINLIGDIPDRARALGESHLHDYGKTPRPGRKLGHITVLSESAAGRDALVEQIYKTVT
jgi:5-(carboxyamino)imidazole ribonucleotide synthase